MARCSVDLRLLNYIKWLPCHCPRSSPSSIAFSLIWTHKGPRFVKWKFIVQFLSLNYLVFICIVHNRTRRKRPGRFLEGLAGMYNKETFRGNTDGKGLLRLGLLKHFGSACIFKELGAQAIPSAFSFLRCLWGSNKSDAHFHWKSADLKIFLGT